MGNPAGVRKKKKEKRRKKEAARLFAKAVAQVQTAGKGGK